jgi:outer membrane protein assembly factor BamB
MTPRALAIATSWLVVGCQAGDNEVAAVDGQAADPPAAHVVDRAPVSSLAPQPRPPVEGALAERLLPVKLPVPKDGKPVAFRFGRENEHAAWLVTLPERAPLLSVAYGGGKIFVGGGFNASSMYALDAKTGARLWQTAMLSDPGPTAPVFDDDELAFNTFSCTIEVLNASTGKTLWTKWLGSETPIQPAIVGDLVIAPHPSASGDGYELSAYQRKTGKLVWASAIDNHVLSAPIVHGDSVYVSTLSGSLYRIGLDGKRQWRQGVAAASAPWIDGDDVHLAVREGRNEAQVVLAAADGKRTRTITTTRSPNDAPSEAVTAWSFEGSRPVVVDGVRYTAMGDRVEARDAHTDQLRWTRNHGKPDGARKIESVTVAGSLAIVTTRDGKLVALDRETGAQRMGFDFGTPVTAQPVIADGWMYIATAKGQVLSFDLGNRAMDGWHMWGGNAQHNR